MAELRTQRIPANLTVEGNLAANTMTLPAASVGNSQVQSNANIAATKLQQRSSKVLAQDQDTTAVPQRRVIHVVRGATGIVNEVIAGLQTACTGNATVTIDLYKNGSSILSATFDLDSGDSAYATVEGTVDTPAVVVGDVLEVVVTVDAGTGALGTGLFVQVQLDEDAA